MVAHPAPRTPLAVAGAVALVLSGSPAQAEPTIETAMTYTVTTLADVGDGICNAVCTLREAVAAAAVNPGRDTIVFADALGGGTVVLTGSQITIGSKLRIDGTNHKITLSGNGISRVLGINSGAEVDLIGLTLTGGAGEGGGAVRNDGRLTVIASVFQDNHSTVDAGFADGDGGAIRSSGTLTVSNSIIRNNSAQYDDGGSQGGGGISSTGTVRARSAPTPPPTSAAASSTAASSAPAT